MQPDSYYGPDTYKYLSGFSTEKYADPIEVRKLFTEQKMAPISFADGLWRAILLASPCAEGIDDAEWLLGCRSKPRCRPCACKQRFIERLSGMSEGGNAFENAQRNLSNWLSGASRPDRREICIRICYALGLRVFPQDALPDAYKRLSADGFLTRVCEQPAFGIADPLEAAHAFALANPLGAQLDPTRPYDAAENYAYALRLAERLGAVMKGDSKSVAPGRMALDRLKTEDELVKLMRGCSGSGSRHQAALVFFEEFYSGYEQEIHLEEEILASTGNHRSRIGRETARKELDAFLCLEANAVSKNHPLADLLYYSGRLKKMVRGEEPPNRRILLLTILANNALPTGVGEEESGEISELPGFSDFFRCLNDALFRSDMALLYPRRPFDFCVLYSYYLMRLAQMNCGADNSSHPVESLAVYFQRAILSVKEDNDIYESV